MATPGSLTPPERQADAADPVSSDAVRGQLERLLASDQFRSAQSLKRFLRYIVVETLEGEVEHLKETVLGADVFRRGPDFDPKTDNVVRVNAGRLRTRLESYYGGAGKGDPVLIEVPRGHYAPRFTLRTGSRPLAAPTDEASAPNQPRIPRKFRPYAVLALVCFGAGYGLHEWLPVNDDSVRIAPLPASLDSFWRPLVEEGGGSVIVAYSSPVFLKNSSGDLVRYRGRLYEPTGVAVDDPGGLEGLVREDLPASMGPYRFNTTYTGTGEAQALHMLTSLIIRARGDPIVHRSRLLRVRDIRENTVVLLGSPSGNSTLAELRGERDFHFADVGSGIVVNNPRAGERSFYDVERDAQTGARRTDYALISMLPGLEGGRRLIVLAGCTTIGTLGAAKFISEPEGVESLRRAFDGQLPRYFQALIRTPIVDDQVSSAELVAARETPER